MKITIVNSAKEVKIVEELATELQNSCLITVQQAKQLSSHEDMHEAHKGFSIVGKNNEDGSYTVDAEIPEWVSVDTLNVVIDHLDEVVTIASAVKAAANAFKVLMKGLKKDLQEVWKNHNMPGEF